MLVLTRKAGQETIITPPSGERSVVRVVENHRGHVVLGFGADRSVAIYRAEVEEQREAAKAGGAS